MINTSISTAAELLLEARVKQKLLKELPESCRPVNQDEAYNCQHELVNKLVSHYGGQLVGYKVACTNKSAQELLGLDGPFYGRLLSTFVTESPSRLRTDDYFMRVIEPEFAFVMSADLPPGKSPHTVEAVSAAIGAAMPSIEIVDSRFQDWKGLGAPSLTADNACHASWIKGKPVIDWTKIDLPNQEVKLTVNGSHLRTGRGDAVMGSPLNVLTWLANMLNSHGQQLKAGDFITTGITCDVYLAESNDEICADFGPLGKVDVKFD